MELPRDHIIVSFADHLAVDQLVQTCILQCVVAFESGVCPSEGIQDSFFRGAPLPAGVVEWAKGRPHSLPWDLIFLSTEAVFL